MIHDCGKWGICCNDGCLEAENCQIIGCKDYGICALGASTNLQVTRCQIRNNKGGVRIQSGASGTFRENTLIGNGDYWHIADDAGHLFRADNITNE